MKPTPAFDALSLESPENEEFGDDEVMATMLKNKGYEVDFSLPWGLPHSGDYDLEELFAWINIKK